MTSEVFLPKLHNLKLGKRKGKSDKPKIRDILHNCPVLFKNVKFLKRQRRAEKPPS